MPSGSKVYIVGVGYSPLRSKGSSGDDVTTPLISAATKALLDAGLTYDHIGRGVATTGSNNDKAILAGFNAFDKDAIFIDKANAGAELKSACGSVSDGKASSVLVVALEKSAAVALVLVAETLLWRHPYLKDSSALLRQSDSSSSKSRGQSGKSLYDVCQIAWKLRGWSENSDKAGGTESPSFHVDLGQTFELSRADGKRIPKWRDVEHRQDGKYRLGYNPASETKEVSLEDFEVVRAAGKSRKDASKGAKFDRKGGDRAALAKL